MGVDVLHLIAVYFGVAQGVGDAACSTRTVSRRRGHVIGIATGAETDQFGIDGRATRFGVLQLFEDQRTGTV